jgi:hypothetical protein
MNTPEPILDYLQNQIPEYPFDHKLDEEFVHELIADFQDLNILALLEVVWVALGRLRFRKDSRKYRN